jgi:hypothetical protein
MSTSLIRVTMEAAVSSFACKATLVISLGLLATAVSAAVAEYQGSVAGPGEWT